MTNPFDNHESRTPAKSETKQRFGRSALYNKAGKNLRSAFRYQRNISQAELCSKNILFGTKSFQVELLDISSTGVCFASEHKLKINTDLTLKVTLDGGANFEIAGKIVRQDLDDENCYGFQFNAYHDGLSEHLFRTQTHAIFLSGSR